MTKQTEQEKVASDVVAQASKVAASTADRAAKVAEQVAKTASETASAVALIGLDIGYIKRDVVEIKEKLEKNYVTKDEFAPIKSIVYGMVSVILLTVLGAIVALVIVR
jgi:phage/plasmid primase-like uncharacterized protein